MRMIFRTLPVLALCVAAILPLQGQAAANGTSIKATSEAVPDAASYAEFLSPLLTGNDLSGAFTIGSATATKSGTGVVTGRGTSTDFYPGGTMVQSAAIDGSATAPGDYSLTLQLTNGFITIDNTAGDADITVLTLVVARHDLHRRSAAAA